MDGEMPDYLLAKDLILQVSLSESSSFSFILVEIITLRNSLWITCISLLSLEFS